MLKEGMGVKDQHQMVGVTTKAETSVLLGPCSMLYPNNIMHYPANRKKKKWIKR